MAFPRCRAIKTKHRARLDTEEDMRLLQLTSVTPYIDKLFREKQKCVMREQQEFIRYLRDCAEKEAAFEKDLEKMCSQELEMAWSRRREAGEEAERRRREKEAAEGVRQQITDNMERWRSAQSVSREYGEQVISEDKEDKRREEERKKMTRERNLLYQRELEDQIRERRQKRDEERRLLEEEQESIRRARDSEEAKMRHLVAEMAIDCRHPYRVGRKEGFGDCEGH